MSSLTNAADHWMYQMLEISEIDECNDRYERFIVITISQGA